MSRKKLSVAIRGSLALLLAASSFALVVPAFAADPPNPSITVRYSDLNLTTEDGAKALYQRIARAARTVCDEALPPRDSLRISHWSQCYQDSVARAVDQVNSAKLTAMYAQVSHRRAG